MLLQKLKRFWTGLLCKNVRIIESQFKWMKISKCRFWLLMISSRLISCHFLLVSGFSFFRGGSGSVSNNSSAGFSSRGEGRFETLVGLLIFRCLRHWEAGINAGQVSTVIEDSLGLVGCWDGGGRWGVCSVSIGCCWASAWNGWGLRRWRKVRCLLCFIWLRVKWC